MFPFEQGVFPQCVSSKNKQGEAVKAQLNSGKENGRQGGGWWVENTGHSLGN